MPGWRYHRHYIIEAISVALHRGLLRHFTPNEADEIYQAGIKQRHDAKCRDASCYRFKNIHAIDYIYALASLRLIGITLKYY